VRPLPLLLVVRLMVELLQQLLLSARQLPAMLLLLIRADDLHII
jgi:hypothetical protein